MSRPGLAVVLTLLAMTLQSGCSLPSMPVMGSAGGKLEMTSRFHDDVRRIGRFDTAIYGYDSQDRFTAVLLDGPIENPREAVTLRFFWRPRAAQTPITPDATNTTMHYIVFAGGDHGDGEDEGQAGSGVGVYSGAGYMYPHQKPGANKLSADIWQGILTLVDASPGYADPLGEALLEGDLTLRRDDAAITDYMKRLSVLVTDRLGYPRLVDGARELPLAARIARTSP